MRTLEIPFELVLLSVYSERTVQRVNFKIPNGKKTIKCDLVISAIGYKTVELDGLQIQAGKVRNSEEYVGDNFYAFTWAKRGPSGVIGTYKSDALDVVKLLIDNLPP